MSHKVMVELNEAQYKAAHAHAEKRGRTVGEDLAHVWWGRMKALADYAEKIEDSKAKFRPYTPRLLELPQRLEIKDMAVKAGVGTAPPKVKPPKAKKKRPAALALNEKRIERAAKRAKAKPAPKAQKAAIKKAAKKPKAPKEAPAHGIDLYDAEPVARAKAKKLSEKTGKPMLSILRDAGRKPDGALLPAKNALGGPASPKADAALKAAVEAPKAVPEAVPPVKRAPLSDEVKAKLKAAGIAHPEVK